MNDEMLRALIRLIPPARALKEQLEQSLHLEIYAGTGDFAVRSFRGIQESVAKIVSDPYVDSLSLPPAANMVATDKEKVSLALLAVSQLVAYFEGQTGVGSMGGGGHRSINIVKAPWLSAVSGIKPETIEKMIDTTGKVEKGEEGKEGQGE